MPRPRTAGADDDRGNTVHGIGYFNDIAGGFAQYMSLAELCFWRAKRSPGRSRRTTEPMAVGWDAGTGRQRGG